MPEQLGCPTGEVHRPATDEAPGPDPGPVADVREGGFEPGATHARHA